MNADRERTGAAANRPDAKNEGWSGAKMTERVSRGGLGWSAALATAGAAVLLSTFNFSLMACACGHLDALALPGSALGAAIAWLVFVKSPGGPAVIRLALMAATVLTTLILLKNAGDMLWFGHGALLG